MHHAVGHVFSLRIIPFPRGFAFGHDGRLFLKPQESVPTAKAITPWSPSVEPRPASAGHLWSTAELSPLDLAIAPNGNTVVSSERPFGAVDAVTSVREYDTPDGSLVPGFSPNGKAEFRKPRGLRFAPNGLPYCVARQTRLVRGIGEGECLGAIVRLPRLNGREPWFFSRTEPSSLGSPFIVEVGAEAIPEKILIAVSMETVTEYSWPYPGGTKRMKPRSLKIEEHTIMFADLSSTEVAVKKSAL